MYTTFFLRVYEQPFLRNTAYIHNYESRITSAFSFLSPVTWIGKMEMVHLVSLLSRNLSSSFHVKMETLEYVLCAVSRQRNSCHFQRSIITSCSARNETGGTRQFISLKTKFAIRISGNCLHKGTSKRKISKILRAVCNLT